MSSTEIFVKCALSFGLITGAIMLFFIIVSFMESQASKKINVAVVRYSHGFDCDAGTLIMRPDKFMPLEYKMLKHASERFMSCPKCGVQPFSSFIRGTVHRPKRWLGVGPLRPHCAIICSACKEIVGYETTGHEFTTS